MGTGHGQRHPDAATAPTPHRPTFTAVVIGTNHVADDAVFCGFFSAPIGGSGHANRCRYDHHGHDEDARAGRH